MKNLVLFLLMFFLSYTLFAQQDMPSQTDQIIIRFRSDFQLKNLKTDSPTVGDMEVDGILSAHKSLAIKKLNTGRNSNFSSIVVKFLVGTELGKIIGELEKLPIVEFAEPDYIGRSSGIRGISPNDQYYLMQWGLKNDGTMASLPSKAGADIQMEDGWAIETGDSTIIVGIIDTGCRLGHPELEKRIWKNYHEIAGNGIDDDGNGFIDDAQGWDFVNIDNDPTDDYGHGTNVAGIIGANGNNLIGYAGVDWHCKLMILKSIDNSGFGYYSWWSDALHYAADNGARVINMSVGGSDVSSTLQDAVNYAINKNVVVVACMMNTNDNEVNYPAAYPGVIAVGATNPDDKRTHPFFWDPQSGSNFGPHISVVAPGNYIYGLDYQSDTQYGYYWGGTSQATPYVSGLSALLLAEKASLTPAQIKTIIQSTAEDQVGDPAEDTPGWDQYYGYGRINAYNALHLVLGTEEFKKVNPGFSIYPNPNKGTFNFLLPGMPVKNSSITVTNFLGQIVFQSEIKDQKTALTISKIPGVYIIKLTQGNEESSEKLIIR
jgi:thermitase